VILSTACKAGVSDVHWQPENEGLKVKFRIDGVLMLAAEFPLPIAVNIVARLKILAGLLTYHTDRPQEGRVRMPDSDVEMRVCTFPTLHGERAVVRLFGSSRHYQFLDDLGLPADVAQPLRQQLAETSGAILISGPAGSGKTTTAYACLREIERQSHDARSLVSVEDPIEVAIDGVAQSQVREASGLDLANALRYLMRQDPEVILVGEIRDRVTADTAIQASLTGHLLLSTFHAGSAAETISRLLDMGIEPYVLRSGLLAILNQRLLRRLCSCAERSTRDDDRLGLDVEHVMLPRGCDLCGGTGYRGRFLLTEMLTLSRSEFARAILERSETGVIEKLVCDAGIPNRWRRAREAVNQGVTSPVEVRRVLGFSESY
jgi:type II secretory ATPase GspE/PulE/Tfp pilus assembly ATPase PilB-like protein